MPVSRPQWQRGKRIGQRQQRQQQATRQLQQQMDCRGWRQHPDLNDSAETACSLRSTERQDRGSTTGQPLRSGEGVKSQRRGQEGATKQQRRGHREHSSVRQNSNRRSSGRGGGRSYDKFDDTM